VIAGGGQTRLGGSQWPGVAAKKSYETGDSQRGHKALNTKTEESTFSGSRHQAATSEDEMRRQRVYSDL
jgi:hypothetical protein